MFPQAFTNKGENLHQLSQEQALFVVFLRHFGCTFCMETLSDLVKQRQQIINSGYKLIFIHLSNDEAKAEAFFSHYGLQEESRIADPSGKLHEAFEIKKGNIWQLLGPRVLWRFFVVGILKGLGINKIQGDVTLLPGTFVLHKGVVVAAFRGSNSADKTHMAALESCQII